MILSPSPQSSPVEGEEGGLYSGWYLRIGLITPIPTFPLRGGGGVAAAGLSSVRRFSPVNSFLDCGIRRNDGWQFVAMHEDGGHSVPAC